MGKHIRRFFGVAAILTAAWAVPSPAQAVSLGPLEGILPLVSDRSDSGGPGPGVGQEERPPAADPGSAPFPNPPQVIRQPGSGSVSSGPGVGSQVGPAQPDPAPQPAGAAALASSAAVAASVRGGEARVTGVAGEVPESFAYRAGGLDAGTMTALYSLAAALALAGLAMLVINRFPAARRPRPSLEASPKTTT